MAENKPYIQQALAAQGLLSLAQRIETRQQTYERDPERIEFENRIRPVIEYTRPEMVPLINHNNELTIINSSSDKMYTSRTTTALEKAADAFVGNVFGDQNWFGIKMAEKALNDEDDIQSWCQKFKDSLYDIYEASNFYENLSPMTKDALSIGQGITFCGDEEQERLPYYQYGNILRTWFTRSRLGYLISVHELVVMTALEAVDFFSLDGDKIGDKLDALAVQKPLDSVTFIHAVYAKNDRILDGIKLEKPRKYVELWIQRNAEENKIAVGDNPMSGIVRQSGYETMPFFDWPYYLVPGETYGRGPFCSGVHTIINYNSFWKSALHIAQKMAGPSYAATEDLKGKIDISPMGVTWMRDTNSKLEEMASRADPRTLLDLMTKMEEEIDDSLHLQLFLMLTMHEGDMTIPELAERLGEKAAALMPRIGTLKRLYLDKSHLRTIQIEAGRGNVDFIMPPDMMGKIDQMGGKAGISITYKGMLKEAQTQMVLGRKMRTAFDLLALVAQVDPNPIKYRMNTEKVTEKILDDTDFPQDCIRSDKEVKQAIDADNEAASLMQAAEAAKIGSEADRNMAVAQQAKGGMA